MGWLSSIFAVPWLYVPLLALKLWMLVDCVRREPDRAFWFWLVLIVPFGEVVYLFVRWLPRGRVPQPSAFRRLTRRREITRLSTAARQIGNPHQWVQLGDALREVREFDRAAAAYDRALDKGPNDLPALWGAALVDLAGGKFASAHDRLQKVLAIDPEYKFGDVSLALGKSLYHCQGAQAALDHMQNHVLRWRQPEALFLCGSLCAELDRPVEAREHLEALLLDLDGSPRAFARRHTVWRARGRRLLRKLPPA